MAQLGGDVFYCSGCGNPVAAHFNFCHRCGRMTKWPSGDWGSWDGKGAMPHAPWTGKGGFDIPKKGAAKVDQPKVVGGMAVQPKAAGGMVVGGMAVQPKAAGGTAVGGMAVQPKASGGTAVGGMAVQPKASGGIPRPGWLKEYKRRTQSTEKHGKCREGRNKETTASEGATTDTIPTHRPAEQLAPVPDPHPPIGPPSERHVLSMILSGSIPVATGKELLQAAQASTHPVKEAPTDAKPVPRPVEHPLYPRPKCDGGTISSDAGRSLAFQAAPVASSGSPEQMRDSKSCRSWRSMAYKLDDPSNKDWVAFFKTSLEKAKKKKVATGAHTEAQEPPHRMQHGASTSAFAGQMPDVVQGDDDSDSTSDSEIRQVSRDFAQWAKKRSGMPEDQDVCVQHEAPTAKFEPRKTRKMGRKTHPATKQSTEKQLGLLLIKPNEWSPSHFRSVVKAARRKYQQYVASEEPWTVPHRVWVWNSGLASKVREVLEECEVPVMEDSKSRHKKVQDCQAVRTLRFLQKNLGYDFDIRYPGNKKRKFEDEADDPDSWAISSRLAGRLLVQCVYDHHLRQQCWKWNVNTMEASGLSRDQVEALLKDLPPYYMTVIEYEQEE